MGEVVGRKWTEEGKGRAEEEIEDGLKEGEKDGAQQPPHTLGPGPGLRLVQPLTVMGLTRYRES